MTLSLLLHNSTPEENAQATAKELFRRATLLQEAADLLNLPYTYEVIEVDRVKREARMKFGMAAAKVIEIMADEMFMQGTVLYAKGSNELHTLLPNSGTTTPQQPTEERSKTG